MRDIRDDYREASYPLRYGPHLITGMEGEDASLERVIGMENK